MTFSVMDPVADYIENADSLGCWKNEVIIATEDTLLLSPPKGCQIHTSVVSKQPSHTPNHPSSPELPKVLPSEATSFPSLYLKHSYVNRYNNLCLSVAHLIQRQSYPCYWISASSCHQQLDAANPHCSRCSNVPSQLPFLYLLGLYKSLKLAYVTMHVPTATLQLSKCTFPALVLTSACLFHLRKLESTTSLTFNICYAMDF